MTRSTLQPLPPRPFQQLLTQNATFVKYYLCLLAIILGVAYLPPSLLGHGGRPFPKCICCILWLTAVTLCVMTQCGAMQQEVEEVTQSAHHDSQVAAASTQTVHLTQRYAVSPDYLHPPGLDPNPGGLDALDAVQASRVVMIGLSGPGGVGKR